MNLAVVEQSQVDIRLRACECPKTCSYARASEVRDQRGTRTVRPKACTYARATDMEAERHPNWMTFACMYKLCLEGPEQGHKEADLPPEHLLCECEGLQDQGGASSLVQLLACTHAARTGQKMRPGP